jgi:hypothetical protein
MCLKNFLVIYWKVIVGFTNHNPNNNNNNNNNIKKREEEEEGRRRKYLPTVRQIYSVLHCRVKIVEMIGIESVSIVDVEYHPNGITCFT